MKRRSTIPKRRGYQGEQTINDCLHNVASALRWLTPRLRNRPRLLDQRYTAFIANAADWLQVAAEEHEKRVARCAR